MTVGNHLLFSEIFLQQIRGETVDPDTLRATLGTIRDTWQYHLPPPVEWDGPAWVPADPAVSYTHLTLPTTPYV